MATLWLIYIIKSLQYIFLIIAIFVYFYLATIVWRKMVYNSNLTLLLLFLPIPSILGSTMYLIKEITKVCNISTPDSDNVINLVMNLGMGGGVFNLPNLIIDRLAATFYPAHYEVQGKQMPWIAIAMITTHIFFTGCFGTLMQVGILSDFWSTIIFISLCIVSALLFSFLPEFARKLHKHYREKHSSVSIRYQSVENIRAAKLLKLLVALYACFFTVETCIFYLFYFVLTNNSIANFVLKTLFIVIISLEILTSITVIARSHPSLRRALPLICRRQEVEAAYANSARDVRSYDGRPLSFSVSSQRQMYFDQLNEFWREKA